jgi:uncharacterized protein (TIGR02594 family)
MATWRVPVCAELIQQSGENNMTVADIQRALLARGYDPGPIDGDAGKQTIGALTAFQKAVGLVADGVAGKLTIAALSAEPTKAATPLKAEPTEPAWLTLARGELGVKEGPGATNNARVVKLFADAGFPGIKTDSTSWCAAAVGAMLHRAGEKPSGSLAARSYEGWGVGLAKPVLGCVATKKRNGSTWQGHVFFVVGATQSQVFGLGGNQGDAWSIAAFPRSEITSFRWPADVPIPAASRLPTTVAGAKAGVSEA